MGERDGRSGFTLIETIVALVLASLLLPILAQAFSTAWSATRAPTENVSALALARAKVFSAPSETFRAGRALGFSVKAATLPVDLIVDDPRLPPLPPESNPKAREPRATPASMLLAEPKALLAAAQAKPDLVLRRLSVIVKTPLGRSVPFDSLRADDAQR